MLQTLDVIIAFVVIMTVVSLLITVVVQMFSAAFSLRGKNLANALAVTFQTIDPKIGEHAHALTEKILKDPILSDSLFTPKNRVKIPPEDLPRHNFEAADNNLLRAADCLQRAADALDKARSERDAIKQDPARAAELPGAEAALTAAKSAWQAAQDARDHADAGVRAALAELKPADPAKPTDPTDAWEKLKVARAALASATPADLATAQTAVKTAQAELTKALPPFSVAESAGAIASWKARFGWKPFGRSKSWGFLNPFGATQLATAVRPGEVYRILHDLSELTPTETHLNELHEELPRKAADLLRALGVPDSVSQESQRKLGALARIADVFATEEEKKVVVNSVANLGITVDRAATQAYDRFQRWFGSAQDRAEQWFQVHVRGVTVVVSVAAAIVLQLDTIEIFRQLRGSPALVQALVNAAPGILEKGHAVLDPGGANTPAHATYGLWLQRHPLYPLANLPDAATLEAYQSALKKRLGEPHATDYALAEFTDAYEANRRDRPGEPAHPDAEALQLAYAAWAKSFPTYRLDPAPGAGQDAKALLDQLKETLEAKGSAEDQNQGRAAWADEFKTLYADGVLAFEKGSGKTLDALKHNLQSAGFDLVPEPIFHRWQAEKPFRFWPHALGTLITAALLTLGAPFWFNLLKNLMNLRPAVATLIERRPQSSPALPQSPVTPVPPTS